MHLAKAYVDQLDRDRSLSDEAITAIRQGIANAEASSDEKKGKMLKRLVDQVTSYAQVTSDTEKVENLAETLKAIASK